MAHDLDIDPERLHPLARRTAALLDGLVPLPVLDGPSRTALAGTPQGADLLAELDAIVASLGRSGHEIAELADRMATAVRAAGHVDGATAEGLGRLVEGW